MQSWDSKINRISTFKMQEKTLTKTLFDINFFQLAKGVFPIKIQSILMQIHLSLGNRTNTIAISGPVCV